MDPRVRDRWQAALRSGDYRQGRGVLARIVVDDAATGDVSMQYCCLGVLCELAVEDGVVERVASANLVGYRAVGAVDDDDDPSFKFPPLAVTEWAGLTTPNPDVSLPIGTRDDDDDDDDSAPGDHRHQTSLANANDAFGLNFAQIADALEQL